LGDRSHTSSSPIVCRPTTHLATSPYFPLVASSVVSVGDLAMVPPDSPRSVVALQETLAPEEPTPEAWEAPVQEMPGADGASLGAASIEVDGTGPIPSDDTEGSLRDLVMRGANIGVARGAALGDVAPAPGPSGATGPGVS
jgi:hypothetical protein